MPACVTALAGGDDVRPAWRNELGGLTFEITAPQDRRFVKWAPAGSRLDFTDEIDRLRWAAAHVRVPEVLQTGADEQGAWLVTKAVPGESAVSRRWLQDPARAATAIGSGLRHLHDTLPVATCPFSWQAHDRLQRISNTGRHDEALARLRDIPPIDRLVVCHGDACAPNTLIDDSGNCSGHVDLGTLGIADRWADLAVATWSLDWNYGPGWQQVLLDAYGIEPDAQRITYYRRLWDLSP